MAQRNELHPGVAAPVSTKYDLTVNDAAFDLTTITGQRMLVRFANDATASWDCARGPIPPDVAITPTRVRLTRLHAIDDVPEGTEGKAWIRADVDIPASAVPLRGEWMQVNIVPEGT